MNLGVGSHVCDWDGSRSAWRYESNGSESAEDAAVLADLWEPSSENCEDESEEIDEVDEEAREASVEQYRRLFRFAGALWWKGELT